MRQLLRGAVDMHIHSGPAVIGRLHSLDVARELCDAGYAGFVIKDHHLPTPALAILVNERFGDGFAAYGSIVLNSTVGGVNVHAVDAACAMGARVVFLPTISAARHIETQGDVFAGSSAAAIADRAVPIAEGGRLLPEVEAVLDYLAKRPGIVLATGHSAADEIDLVIRRAVQLGMDRILVNHPLHTIGATREQMEAWSRLDGVYLEVNAVDMIGMSNTARFPMSLVEEYFRRFPAEKTVVTSDFGQIKNGSPVEGMLRFLEAIHAFGVDENAIVTMIRDNPARLLRR
jgi:hypothetical protein